MHISAQQQEAQKRIKTQMWTFLCFTTNVNRKPVGAFIVEAAAVGICASRDGHGPHLTARSDNGHAGSSCTIVAGATEREQGQKCLQCSRSWTAGIPAAAAALPSSAMLQTNHRALASRMRPTKATSQWGACLCTSPGLLVCKILSLEVALWPIRASERERKAAHWALCCRCSISVSHSLL